MLMPIVSMNKMAMNESVAATCCYREKASATNVYWEVLNGGWIGSGYVENMDWISEHLKAWAVLPYDVKGLVSGGSYVGPGTTPTIGKQTYTDISGELTTAWFIDNALAEDFFMHNVALSKGSNCSHDNGGLCAYKEWKIEYKNNQHFSSTTKHDTAGTVWSNPHGAKQFAS